MATKRYSLCLNIEGFMRAEKYPEGYTYFEHDDGSPMEPHEALEFLATAKAKGHKVIPFSADCGNPCKQPGCTGFDYSGGGCPGHDIVEA